MAFRSAGGDVASVVSDSILLNVEFRTIRRIEAWHPLKLAQIVRLSYRRSFWN